MKRIILILSFFIIVACNQNQSTGADMDKESTLFPKSRSLVLTNEEIKIYSQKALQGDNQAAIKLYMHYSYGKNNIVEGLKWVELAAKNGDVMSMHNVSVTYSGLKKYPDALYWAERYKEFEPEDAEKLIQDLKSKLNEE